MILDRTLQREILEELREAYPESVDFQSRTEQKFQANLFYLQGHGFIEGQESTLLNSPRYIPWATITSPGLDFLEDDGGISAILKTFTVRLEGENILPIFEKIIAASQLPAEEKKSISQTLRSLPGTVLGTLVTKALEMGIEHPEKVVNLITGAVSQIQI